MAHGNFLAINQLTHNNKTLLCSMSYDCQIKFDYEYILKIATVKLFPRKNSLGTETEISRRLLCLHTLHFI